VRGKCDGTDALNHCGTARFLIIPHVARCDAPPDILL
jgi:hypothetical protein